MGLLVLLLGSYLTRSLRSLIPYTFYSHMERTEKPNNKPIPTAHSLRSLRFLCSLSLVPFAWFLETKQKETGKGETGRRME